MSDEHFRIQVNLKNPEQETPEIRQYLDSVAAIVNANAALHAQLQQVKEDLITFGTTEVHHA